MKRNPHAYLGVRHEFIPDPLELSNARHRNDAVDDIVLLEQVRKHTGCTERINVWCDEHNYR
jgi:hypothetical protein